MKIINVMASSLDGKIAAFPLETDAARAQNGFLIPEDEQLLRDELSHADAVITGANSLRVTGTVSELKNQKGKCPIWVVYSTHPETLDQSFLRQSQVPRVLVAQEYKNQDFISQHQTESLDFISYGNAKPAAFVFDYLSRLGCSRVLLFGGGFINLMFYQERLVDELKLTLCPYIFAGLTSPCLVNPGLGQGVKFDLIASHTVRSHVFLHYRVQK
jgi:riboflavin biosynthesis pyrimidine reductase